MTQCSHPAYTLFRVGGEECMWHTHTYTHILKPHDITQIEGTEKD